MEKHDSDWMTGCPWYNTYICKKYMETCLKNPLEMKELTDIISFVLLMHMEKKPSEHDYGSISGGYLLPQNSTTEALVLLSETIDFIGCWIQALEKNF